MHEFLYHVMYIHQLALKPFKRYETSTNSSYSSFFLTQAVEQHSSVIVTSCLKRFDSFRWKEEDVLKYFSINF